MRKTDWGDLLYKFGGVQFGKLDESTGDESNDLQSRVCETNEPINDESVDEPYSELWEANEPFNDESINEPIVNEANDTDPHNRVYEANESVNDKIDNDIEFTTKRKLNDYYAIDVKTI